MINISNRLTKIERRITIDDYFYIINIKMKPNHSLFDIVKRFVFDKKSESILDNYLKNIIESIGDNFTESENDLEWLASYNVSNGSGNEIGTVNIVRLYSMTGYKKYKETKDKEDFENSFA